MNARLGFSIAAHLDPDVLIIDEVLAVGDYAFQRKAFGRIRELARSGLPVVVVSHQLERIAELCTDAVLISRGEVIRAGAPADVIGAYMRGSSAVDAQQAQADSPVLLDSACAPEGNVVSTGETVLLRIHGTRRGEIARHVEPVGVIVRSAQTGEMIYATGTTVHGLEVAHGEFTLDVRLQMNVQPGTYLVDVGVWDRAGETQLYVGPSLNLRVTEGTIFLGGINLNSEMELTAVHRAVPARV
jgi:ABC-type uncharacterized transport system ATPase subunit